ncbi:glycosyltransferase [Ruicaihuangia caeni]|uniref:glycosyltransferase n=1 Tax=Ruicaihuangia caeni TaxID=3042517 RepID=UPI00338F10A4
MGHFLFVTWDGGGNVPPALGIATELAARGHDVRFMGHPSQSERFSKAGLPFTSFLTARPFDSSDVASTRRILATFADRAMGSDVVAAARHDDVIVVDALLFGVMAALQQAGRRYVVLEHTLDGWLRRSARGPLGLALRFSGLRASKLVDGGEPTIVASLAELDAGHGDVVHTGPIVSGVPALAQEPTVLVSLSTFAYRDLDPVWQHVLDALAAVPARVIATTGPAVAPNRLHPPDNVEIHEWLAHERIMPEVSVVVCHGGHATTVAALAHDLPLLVLPLDTTTDQPMIGRAIQRAGAGRVLNRRSPIVEIRSAIEELLDDGPHRAAAARLGAEIRETDGARRAADVLESKSVG